jgi:hypothetical protein
VPRSIAQARQWLQRSVALGYSRAKGILKAVDSKPKPIRKSRKAHIERLARRIRRVYDLILAADASEPRYFQHKDRKALRTTILFAFESEEELAKYRSARTAKLRWWISSHVNLHTRVANEDHQTIMFLGHLIPGVHARVRRKSTLARIAIEHRTLIRELEDAETGDERRLSVLLELIQVEHLFLGYTWRS